MSTAYNKYLSLRASNKITSPFFTYYDLRVRIGWFINLRWIAIMGVLVSVPVSHSMLHFKIAYGEILTTVCILFIINVFYFFLWRHLPYKDELQELFFAEVQIIMDLVMISFLINYSGGITNPFFFLFLVQVILSGIIFPGRILPYINASIAVILVTFWGFAEYFSLVHFYNLGEGSPSFSYLVTALCSFYIICFSGIYIINNFMLNYRSLKIIVDEKSSELEKVIEERNRAFRYAAHELKSPMVAIQSTLDVVLSLYSGEMKPEVKEMVMRAEKRSEQIITMVKELISITQYNLGMEKETVETVDFQEFLEHNVFLSKDYAIEKKISLSVEHETETFETDIIKNGLEKVIMNLVTNAIRYTPKGGRVRIISFRKRKSFGFKVEDTGIGISDDDKAKIFNEFYRAKNAREMEHLGTGLGLSLVAEIIKKCNGSITVESEEGKGSAFIVDLPLPESQPIWYEYKLIKKPSLFE